MLLVFTGHFVDDLIEFDTCKQQGYSIVRREYPFGFEQGRIIKQR